MVYCNQVDSYLDQAKCSSLFWRNCWYIVVRPLADIVSLRSQNKPTASEIFLFRKTNEYMIARSFFFFLSLCSSCYSGMVCMLIIICTQNNSQPEKATMKYHNQYFKRLFIEITVHPKLHWQGWQWPSYANVSSKNVFITCDSSAQTNKNKERRLGHLRMLLFHILPYGLLRTCNNKKQKQTMAVTLSRCLYGDEASL